MRYVALQNPSVALMKYINTIKMGTAIYLKKLMLTLKSVLSNDFRLPPAGQKFVNLVFIQ